MRRISFNTRSLIGFLSFNLGWWVCAFGGLRPEFWWAGPALLPLWIALHLRLAPVPLGEAAFLAFIALFGFAFDTLLIQAGLFSTTAAGFAPVWLVCMWVFFGMTLEGLLVFRRRLWWVAGMGAATGPLSYVWGEGLQIVRYARPFWFSLSVHAVIWAAVLLILFMVRDFCLRAALKYGGSFRWTPPISR